MNLLTKQKETHRHRKQTYEFISFSLEKALIKVLTKDQDEKKIPEELRRGGNQSKVGGLSLAWEKMGRHLSQSVWAAITKYHRLGSL